MILGIAALLLLCTTSTTAWGFTSRTEHWIEDVALHDGRLVTVEREVDWTTEIILTDPFFGLPTLPHLSKGGPDKFWLKFEHPDTRETIKWQGERHYTPVLLDIVDSVPYLVVFGGPNKSTEKIYGCPELPYVFLKYGKGVWGEWIPISVEAAPQVLRNANLSPDYPGSAYTHLSTSDVQRMMPRREGSTGHSFQRSIPRNYDEWNYIYKNNHRNERKVWDCRPSLQPLPDVLLPKPVDIALEAVESQDYTVSSADEYYKSLSERKGTVTRANCSKLFKPPDPENLMLSERFINDPTGNIRLPYSGPTPYPSGRMLERRAERYCDDKFVWFVAGYEQPEKTNITKYTASGNLLYNMRMDDPKTTGIKPHINMVLDSMTAENGYFYFYWDQSLPLPTNSSKVYPHRMTKFRFLEPILGGVSE